MPRPSANGDAASRVASALHAQPTAVAPGTPRLFPSLRTRRLLAGALLLLPSISVVSLDYLRRGPRIRAFEPEYVLTYSAAVVESMLVWAALVYAASRRRGRLRWLNSVLFVIAFTFTMGGQSYFFQQYNAYLNVDVSVFASNFKDSVLNQLFADIGNYARAKLPPFIGALLLLWFARRLLRPRRRFALIVGALAPLLLIGSFFIPTQHRHAQASTPDVLYLHAVGGLLRTQFGLTDESNQVRPRARASLPVPPLARAAEAPPRNVVFVILESVRADSVCIEPDPDCRKTHSTNLLFPDRFPLTQMRSMDSCTAISLAVLWSGVRPTESREVLHTWPLVFDYARAAGYDTAFWTSQNMMFGNARLWVKNLGVSNFASATDLEPTSDLDMGAPEGLLARHVKAQFAQLKEPFLAVIQLSNVHYPYFVDENLPAPFEPWTTSKAPEDNPYFKNYYQNSVYQQDLHVAEFLSHIKQSAAGPRTVVVYTSDHGEAFREHGQMGHTFSIFDEEIHVPAWIDAPEGTLTEPERAALRGKRDAYTFHVDLVPTVLDLMGVVDAPQIAEYRARLPGHSLLRPELTDTALPMTNCAGVWSCAFENWGYMRGSLKLEARSWDQGYRCFDVATDPGEHTDLGLEACQSLLPLARQTFGRLPGQGIERSE
ncbi:MAG TPA: sulfatase-like hydrolase/transferase [Polyangiaceae bacterium]|nr:sulfatase-like hydrolase/transferase [Polyangiaceae bacterium]